MSDDADQSHSGADAGEADEPIPELQNLAWKADEAFSRLVTGRIERRLLTGRLLDVAWSAPLMVLLELLRVPIESLTRNRRS